MQIHSERSGSRSLTCHCVRACLPRARLRYKQVQLTHHKHEIRVSKSATRKRCCGCMPARLVLLTFLSSFRLGDASLFGDRDRDVERGMMSVRSIRERRCDSRCCCCCCSASEVCKRRTIETSRHGKLFCAHAVLFSLLLVGQRARRARRGWRRGRWWSARLSRD